ncbi:MAG: biotin/lipoyl-containing protein [Dehalococcoidia bacterium]|nr:biotin/lipoyl-containing protein [Dehalococcoidia bacterium]
MKLVIGDQEFDVLPGGETITVGDESFAVRLTRRGNILTVYVNEKPFAVQLPEATSGGPEEGPVMLLVDAKEYQVELKGKGGGRPRPKTAARRAKAAGAQGAIVSQMTGRVIKVNVKPGDNVNEGDVLLVVEAMKMENEIAAPTAGVVKEVSVAAGARVSEGDMLVVLEPAS